MTGSTPDARPPRLGIQIQQVRTDFPRYRDIVRRAEDAGVDVIYVWDHFFPIDGDIGERNFEAWTILGALAELTTRVQIGPLVSSAGFRNPDLLADMARTVDHISGGRVILGIGAGWYRADHDGYGIEFGTVGSRIDHLADSLERIRSRFARLNPPPLGPMPVLIGGGGERKTLRLVARYADIWHAFVGPDTHPHKAAVLAEHCAAIGRDPSEIEHAAEITGEGDAFADRLLDQGVTLFNLSIWGPDYPLEELDHWLRWRDARRG